MDVLWFFPRFRGSLDAPHMIFVTLHCAPCFQLFREFEVELSPKRLDAVKSLISACCQEPSVELLERVRSVNRLLLSV